MHHEQRLFDLVGVAQRRNALEEGAHFWFALVAVLGAAQVAAVALGVGEEAHEVGNADDVDRAGNALGEMHARGQAHVAAVASPGDEHARGVEFGLRGDPVEQCAEVLDRVFALHAVVEREEGLAVAGGAAHVGLHDGDAQLVDEVVPAPHEAERGLRLGAAMHQHDDRAFAGKSRRRGRVDGRHCQVVEALPAHDALIGKALRVHARRRLRLGPGRDSGAGQVERMQLVGALGAVDRERELPAVAVKACRVDAALRKSCKRWHRLLAQRLCVDEAQFLAAVGVDAQRQQAAVVAEIGTRHVPRNVRGDALQGTAGQVMQHQLAELARAVAEHEQARAVAPPADGVVRRAHRLARRRQQLPCLAVGQRHLPDARLAGRAVVDQRELPVVPRHRAAEPAGAGQLSELAPVFGLHRVDEPQRRCRRAARAALGGAVQRHGAVDQLGAAVQPAQHLVALVGVGQQRDGARVQVQAIELVRLVAAAAARKHHVAAALRFVAGLVDRIGEIGQLLGRGHRAVDAKQLLGVGAGLAVRHQHFISRRVPVGETVAAKVGVFLDLAHQRHRNWRYALQHQVLVGQQGAGVG